MGYHLESMLENNVYLLYPPGYSGNYINWAINASDKDLQAVTVKDPVNNTGSKQFGGSGTSHLHVRIPTHQGIHHHLAWMILNKPVDKRVYIISTDLNEIYFSIQVISQSDPNAVFVSIHNNNDSLVDAYGNINCATKWPTYLDIMSARRKPVYDGFDPYNCSDDRRFRNFLVDRPDFFRHNTPINRNRLEYTLWEQEKWFEIRNRAQPHEVDESMYVTKVDLTDRFFELSCQDICTDKFLPWFEQFMQASQVSSDYNLDTVKDNHKNYVQAQPNLQWFNSVEQWKLTGKLDDYLLSHSVIEAHLILEIFRASNIVALTEEQQLRWTVFYNQHKEFDWPDAPTEHDFFKLPPVIQRNLTKIAFNSGYKFNLTKKPNFVILSLDWKNMTTSQINDAYQRSK